MTLDPEAAWWSDAPSDLPPQPPDIPPEVPQHLDVLPDGRESLTVGDVPGLADLLQPQGDNPYGFQGTCGLCSCEGVLRQFGVNVTEADVLEHALRNGLCHVADAPAECGGTTPGMQAEILSDYGVPAHVEQCGSLEELAAALEQGRGVIVEANAGVLWDDAAYYDFGSANHAVVVTGVGRDPGTGEIQGFYLNDSGSNQAGRFIDPESMAVAWLDAGGVAVVTDVVGLPPDTAPTGTQAEQRTAP
ncbi:C39 family peptidase [Streptomyces sp. NPDC054802]